MREPVVVAVDVGGSGLRLQVTYAGEPGPVRTTTGVRVGATGIDLDALVRDAGGLLAAEGVVEPDALVWSMRGLLFLADRGSVLRAVREGLGARRTVVVSDAVANLVGAVGDLHPAACVAAGTGAVAFGTDFAEHWSRVDGWGHVLGDVGSGAWIGLAGLRAALREVDGLAGGSTRLHAAGSECFGPAEGWPRLVMTTADAPERLASFAPRVVALAGTDAVAATICAEAGQGLAEALLGASAGLEDPLLVATGGVLAAEPIVRALDATLRAHGRRRTVARGGALAGAVHLGTCLVRDGHLPEHPAYLLVA
jgi:N-acetylglucosamine kinase-like BadF-type ATPase